MVRFTVETLLAYVRGELDAATAREVAASAAPGGETAATLDWLDWLETDARAAGVRPPPGLRPRLDALFDNRGLVGEDLDAELVALLLHDSDATPVGAGLRGASEGDLRRLVFASDMADVVVDLVRVRDADAGRVVGQVLPPPGRTSHELAVRLGGAECGPTTGTRRVVAVDDTGRFTFEGVPRSVRWLTVVIDRVRLRLDLPSDVDEE